MYSSWFSYPVSRPYPFRWFTPVAITGTIILTILFTLINLASSAFYLKPIFTDNPNGTVDDSTRWFMKAPFNWDSNLESICQPKMLSPGDKFFTTNLGLQYTVKKITKENTPGSTKSYPSIPYLNNPLQDCYLNYLQIDLLNSDTEGKPTGWLSWIKSTVAAKASCTLTSDKGPVRLDLELVYKGRSDRTYDYVIEDNYTTHASTWWGSRLLNVYFAGTLQVMSQLTTRPDRPYCVGGQLSYHRNRSYTDIHELGYFGLHALFISSDGQRQVQGTVKVSSLTPFFNMLEDLKSTQFAHDNPLYARIVSESLHYTKLLHSLVAVDLGNCQSPNLLREDEISYAILPPDNPNRQWGGLLNNSKESDHDERYTEIPSPRSEDGQVMLNETYRRFASTIGRFDCKNVTIGAQYLCSVPESKSPGVMLLAIVLANLVFLQASWKLLNWVAAGMLPVKQRASCQGCIGDENDISLKERGQASGSYQEVSTSEGN